MSKNFASIYSGGNDASALNQSFFLKAESLRGTPIAPVGTDFFYSLSGGSVNFSQSIIESPHRTGNRSINNIIKEKTATAWSLSTYLNIKTANPYGTSVDTPIRALWRQVLGKETDTGTSYKFDPTSDPSFTFTLLENLDVIAKQMVGGFVDQVELSLPGDGQSQCNWSGRAQTVYHAGIAKSTSANTGNTFECDTPAEAKRFDVGSMVMVIKGDGSTRSTDTPTGSFRRVVSGDATLGNIVVDGAALTDSDGTVGGGVYLCYYEPATQVAIDEPQTGLVGSVAVDTLGGLSCVRSVTVSLNNNHQVVDYCFGTDKPSGPIFIPSGKRSVTVDLELNLNAALVEFMKSVRQFNANEIDLVVGDVLTRHFAVNLPKVIFNVPEIPVPESGSIPVSFSGMAMQSVDGAADEIQVFYK
jgi:hypothetical protein